MSFSLLAALLEFQQAKREEFEREMKEQRMAFEEEMREARTRWDKEKAERDQEAKEQTEAVKKQRQREIEMKDDKPCATLEEWYGDLSQLFDGLVHMSIFDYCQRRISSKIVEVDYDRVKKLFYEEDKPFWDEEQELIKDQHDLIAERNSRDDI